MPAAIIKPLSNSKIGQITIVFKAQRNIHWKHWKIERTFPKLESAAIVFTLEKVTVIAIRRDRIVYSCVTFASFALWLNRNYIGLGILFGFKRNSVVASIFVPNWTHSHGIADEIVMNLPLIYVRLFTFFSFDFDFVYKSHSHTETSVAIVGPMYFMAFERHFNALRLNGVN